MGLGPNKTSLLTKLGKLQAWEMPLDDLIAIITADQARRTIQRSLGRSLRDGSAAKARRQEAKAPTLESLGFAPAICSQLRLTGASEQEIIKLMREKGLL